jgi:uncharacterized membrane protein
MALAAASRRLPVGRALAGAVLVGYPALVWFGLTHWNIRLLALVLLSVLVPSVVLRLRRAGGRGLRGMAVVPLTAVCGLGLGALLDASGFVLIVPAAVNGVLLASFMLTLRPGSTPMIERMARLRVANLSGAKRSWCRMWTWVWCAFFVANGGVALGLARAGSLRAWALYNGLIAYGLIGALFAVEWLLRRHRFGPERSAADDAVRPPRRQPDARLGGAGRDDVGGPHDGERPRPGAA